MLSMDFIPWIPLTQPDPVLEFMSWKFPEMCTDVYFRKCRSCQPAENCKCRPVFEN